MVGDLGICWDCRSIIKKYFPNCFLFVPLLHPEITCPSLIQPYFGALSTQSNVLDTTAIFSCVPGYQLIGNSTLTCEDDGRWNGSQPDCVGG